MKKLLLVAFTTTRAVAVGEGKTENKRARYAAKSVVDLTEDEMTLLDRLTKKTGKLHYRDPIREGGEIAESQPVIVEVPDFEGQDVPIDTKTVPLLRAYLTFHGVAFKPGDDKAALVDLAKKQEAGQNPGAAQDNGL